MRIEQSEFHDHLVRGLTHKMNNILSLFHGHLGLLIEDKKLDRETVAGLIRIRESADAAARLMDRTKSLATSSSTQWREVAPEDFLRTLLPALNLYTERGVQLQAACDPGLPDLWADTARLRVAVKEIVKNACEASPANGIVRVTIKAHTQPVGPAAGAVLQRQSRGRPSASPTPATASRRNSRENLPPLFLDQAPARLERPGPQRRPRSGPAARRRHPPAEQAGGTDGQGTVALPGGLAFIMRWCCDIASSYVTRG